MTSTKFYGSDIYSEVNLSVTLPLIYKATKNYFCTISPNKILPESSPICFVSNWSKIIELMYFKMWCVFFELVETENKIPGIVKICCTSKEQFPFDFWILWIITNMAARVLLLSNKFVFVCHWIRLWRNVTSKSSSFQMSQSESHFELAYQRGGIWKPTFAINDKTLFIHIIKNGFVRLTFDLYQKRRTFDYKL